MNDQLGLILFRDIHLYSWKWSGGEAAINYIFQRDYILIGQRSVYP